MMQQTASAKNACTTTVAEYAALSRDLVTLARNIVGGRISEVESGEVKALRERAETLITKAVNNRVNISPLILRAKVSFVAGLEKISEEIGKNSPGNENFGVAKQFFEDMRRLEGTYNTETDRPRTVTEHGITMYLSDQLMNDWIVRDVFCLAKGQQESPHFIRMRQAVSDLLEIPSLISQPPSAGTQNITPSP